ncbi:MAG: indole-3-glycerol phosphate synthase TrpC [Microthrixaceae bacterium]
MATYLDRILEHHRERARADGRSDSEVMEAVAAAAPPRGFVRSLEGRGTLAVISEVKRRSPSKGPLAEDLDPAELARSYESAGAACLSVLTDEAHFGGSASDLVAARAATALPVLRKDFTVCARDVLDARAMGAGAVLLIVAALSDAELGEFDSLAAEVGLDVLVEVHDEGELERALRNTRGS